MLPGHYGLAFLSKKIAPKASLATLYIATGLLDLLFVPFALLGLDTLTVPAWSHSLVMSIVWAILSIVVSQAVYKEHKTSLVVGGLVLSHFVLDVIALKSTLPVLFDPDIVVRGLGLGGNIAAEVLVEFSLLGLGVYVYRDTTIMLNTPYDPVRNSRYFTFSWILTVISAGLLYIVRRNAILVTLLAYTLINCLIWAIETTVRKRNT